MMEMMIPLKKWKSIQTTPFQYFEQLTKEVKVYTGPPSTETFNFFYLII